MARADARAYASRPPCSPSSPLYALHTGGKGIPLVGVFPPSESRIAPWSFAPASFCAHHARDARVFASLVTAFSNAPHARDGARLRRRWIFLPAAVLFSSLLLSSPFTPLRSQDQIKRNKRMYREDSWSGFCSRVIHVLFAERKTEENAKFASLLS